MVSRNLTAPFGCPAAYIYHANRFAEMIEKLGVEPVGIEALSFGRRGFKLSLCSGTNEFLATLERDRAKLELVRMDQQRVPLAEGGAANQSTWDQFTKIVRQLEDK